MHFKPVHLVEIYLYFPKTEHPTFFCSCSFCSLCDSFAWGRILFDSTFPYLKSSTSELDGFTKHKQKQSYKNRVANLKKPLRSSIGRTLFSIFSSAVARVILPPQLWFHTHGHGLVASIITEITQYENYFFFFCFGITPNAWEHPSLRFLWLAQWRRCNRSFVINWNQSLMTHSHHDIITSLHNHQNHRGHCPLLNELCISAIHFATWASSATTNPL